MVMTAACVGVPPSCEEMCASAVERMPECLQEWEQDWRDRGYLDATDFDNGCDTWVWEQLMLVGEQRTDAACAVRRDFWRVGTCDQAFSTAWSPVTGS